MEERYSRVSFKLNEVASIASSIWTVNVGMRQKENSLSPCCSGMICCIWILKPFFPHNNILDNPAPGCGETSAMCP